MATENARVNLYINKDQYEKSITQAKRKTAELEEELGKLTEGSKKFAATKSEIDAYRKKIEFMEGKISGKVAPSIREMEVAVRKLANELRHMPTNAPERAMKVEQLRKARAELNGVKGELGGVNKQWDTIGQTLARVGIAGGIMGIVAAGKNLIQQIIPIRSEFEKFTAVLTNAFNGDQNKAVQSMEMINQLAKETPFGVRELTESFVKLVNQGFEPTREEIIQMGDLAATTGKQYDQLTEAIIDAQVGEFERLKEFGIRAQKHGDQVTFTFRGVKQEVAFTSEAIQDYIIGLGQMEGVSGAMAAISQTLGGRISNLGDSWDQLLNTLGESEVLGDTVDGMIDMVDAIQKWMSLDAAEEVDNQRISLLTYQRELNNANTSEERRKEIIDELKAIYPGYLANIDSEKSSLEDVNSALDDVNANLQTRARLMTINEDVVEATENLQMWQQKLGEYQGELELNITKAADELGITMDQLNGLSYEEQIRLLEENSSGWNRLAGNVNAAQASYSYMQQYQAAVTAGEKTLYEAEETHRLTLERLGITQEAENDILDDKVNKIAGLKLALDALGVGYDGTSESLEYYQGLLDNFNRTNGGEGATEATIKALAKLEETITATRDRVYDGALEAEERETAQAQRKYGELIAEAEKYGRDTADILELQEQELAQIREKYAEAKREKELKEQEQELKRLEQIRQRMFTTLADQQANELADLDELRANGLISFEEYLQEKANIEQYYAEQRVKQDKDALTAQLAAFKSYVDTYAAMAGSVSNLINSLKESELATVKEVQQGIHESDEAYAKRKEDVEREKLEIAKKYAGLELLMKVSEIVANTAAAIMQGYAQLGPIAGTVFAVTTGITGGIQAGIAYKEYEKIKGYSGGGYTGDGLFKDSSGYNVAGVVHNDEYVVPKRLLEQPDIARIVSLIEDVRTGKSQGFAQGGPTSATAATAIAEAPIQPNTSDNSILVSLLTQMLEKLNKPSLAYYDDTEARKLRKLIKDFDSVENSSKQ